MAVVLLFLEAKWYYYIVALLAASFVIKSWRSVRE
jgi:hypothetical protein